MTANKYTASLRGRNNRQEGNNFEDMILTACKHYYNKGIADIDKTPEPVRQISKMNERGQFLACYEAKAQPDFKGTLKGGRSIVFDAKATTTEKIAVSVLSDEQRKHLLLHHKLGALSGVMITYSFQRYFFLPIDIFLDAKELNGHAYFTPEEAQRVGEYIRHTGTFLDFLGGHYE